MTSSISLPDVWKCLDFDFIFRTAMVFRVLMKVNLTNGIYSFEILWLFFSLIFSICFEMVECMVFHLKSGRIKFGNYKLISIVFVVVCTFETLS